MRPLGTQRPERPKSELWHKKYEKCGFSKAGDVEWVRAAAVDARASKKRPYTSTCGGSQFPDNSLA
jgi:hypothetical protein